MVRYVRPVFAPVWQRSTYRHLFYVLIGGLLGLGYLLILAAGLVMGVLSTTVVALGAPILLILSGFNRTLRDVERDLANAMLGTAVPVPADRPLPTGKSWRRLRAAVRDPAAWRTVLWLGLRASLGSFALLIVGSFVIAVVAVILDFVFGQSPLGWPARAVPLGMALALGIVHFVNLLAWVHRMLAMPLLGPSQAERLVALKRRNEELALRTRLARELHDSVGHTMAVAVLQAAARKVFDDDPGFALKALATIETVGRGALDELDRMLGILREEPRSREGEPGLQDVGELLARTRAAGLPVTVTISGDTTTVPDDLGREAYRIIQEGCTNVLRHAGLVPTDVSLHAGDGLELLVLNGPPKMPSPTLNGGGRGLSGVAERVSSLGGELQAGPTQEGGYRLRVHLPPGAGG